MQKGIWTEDRLKLRPFPQGLPLNEQTVVWKAIREDLVDGAGFAIFVAGNKIDQSSGKVVPSNGMEMEFNLAKSKRKYLVPIGATGFLAKQF